MVKRRGRGQEGAAVFVVVMVVTLLTAIGIFAVRSTSMVNAATGFNRHSVQAQYLADFGLQSLAAYRGMGNNDTQPGEDCFATRNQPPPVAGAKPQCAKAFLTEIQKNVVGTQMLDPGSVGAPGSLSPFDPSVAGAVTGNFRIEITDDYASQQIAAGQDAARMSFRRATLTSYGLVGPTGAEAGSATCNATAANASGVQLMRAHLEYGPVMMGAN